MINFVVVDQKPKPRCPAVGEWWYVDGWFDSILMRIDDEQGRRALGAPYDSAVFYSVVVAGSRIGLVFSTLKDNPGIVILQSLDKDAIRLVPAL